jgi:Fur family iron response transcriptional regulator
VDVLKPNCLAPAQIEAVLRARGIQPTAQRIAIGRYVLCEADHPTAEHVKQWVDENFPKISLATVYNTLRAFVEAGLLEEVRLPDRDAVVFDNLTTPHHHFLDEATGAVHDLPFDAVEVRVQASPEFDVRSATVLVRGTRRAPGPTTEQPT